MKKVLRDLWYNYLMEECGKIDTQEEKRAVAMLAEVEENLLTTMDEEQKALLGKAQECLDEVYAFSIERAFEKGVVFSFAFLSAVWDRK